MSRRFDRLSCANSARMASVRSFVLFFRESQHQLVKLPFPASFANCSVAKSVPYIFTSSAGSRWISHAHRFGLRLWRRTTTEYRCCLKGTATRHDYARERQHAIGFTSPIIRKQFLVS